MRRTAKKKLQISARISESTKGKLLALVRSSGSNMSDVIMQAIEDYYHRTSIPQVDSPYEFFKQRGLVGCVKGNGTLSQNYKQEFEKALQQKGKSGAW